MTTTTKKVLLADDDRDLVQALAARCLGLGLQVIVAYDAMTALMQINRQRPDVVCLDVNMPAGNGLCVCEMLAGNEELSAVPVIIVTGRTDEETVRRCHDMGAYYVLKSSDVWPRVEPLLREILGLAPPQPSPAETPQQPPLEKRTSVLPQHGLTGLLQVVAREPHYGTPTRT
jgi:DNA-binding response OmpR family regulator